MNSNEGLHDGYIHPAICGWVILANFICPWGTHMDLEILLLHGSPFPNTVSWLAAREIVLLAKAEGPWLRDYTEGFEQVHCPYSFSIYLSEFQRMKDENIFRVAQKNYNQTKYTSAHNFGCMTWKTTLWKFPFLHSEKWNKIGGGGGGGGGSTCL